MELLDVYKRQGNYMVKREKETLIKIIELRNFQRDIILILNRISDVYKRQVYKVHL